jgi:hypothetical protein
MELRTRLKPAPAPLSGCVALIRAVMPERGSGSVHLPPGIAEAEICRARFQNQPLVLGAETEGNPPSHGGAVWPAFPHPIWQPGPKARLGITRVPADPSPKAAAGG